MIFYLALRPRLMTIFYLALWLHIKGMFYSALRPRLTTLAFFSLPHGNDGFFLCLTAVLPTSQQLLIVFFASW
jgi:hypothetical protein